MYILDRKFRASLVLMPLIHQDKTKEPLTTPEGLFAVNAEIYWLSITATNDHEINPGAWQDIDTGDQLEQEHWLGWLAA